MVAVIVFDLDDTLYLERDFIRSGFAAVDRWISDRFAVSGFFEAAWALFEGGQRGHIFDVVLPTLEIPVSSYLIGDLISIYRGHVPTIHLAPDAEESLTTLCSRCRTALLTDGWGPTQARKVAALGLIGRLQPVIYTDNFGRGKWKPHPHCFTVMQDEFGLPAHDFVYVGDNPSKDFLAPRQLGWKTIRVRRPEGQYAQLRVEPAMEADRTVTTLRELDLAEL